MLGLAPITIMCKKLYSLHVFMLITRMLKVDMPVPMTEVIAKSRGNWV